MARVYVLGSLNADLVIVAARPPRAGETLAGDDMAVYPGGKGANQAVAAARLGAQTALIGAVGEDGFAEMLLAEQRGAGVDVERVARSERPTGVAMILRYPGGDNSIVISPGANASVTPEMALAGLANIGEGDVLLCQLETPLEAVQAALEHARARGVLTVLDPAPARPLPAGLLAAVDVLAPNEHEAATLLGADEEPRRAAELLRALGPQTVIVKLGERGSVTSGPEGAFETAAFAVEAVDTTAAGDVFAGALAARLVERARWQEALRFASAAAAISVTRLGAQPSAPTRVEVERFLVSRE